MPFSAAREPITCRRDRHDGKCGRPQFRLQSGLPRPLSSPYLRRRKATSVRLSDLTDATADALKSAGALLSRPDDADPAPRRHRPGALGQDRVHHRAGAQPGRRRAPALLRRHGRGPHRARLSRAAARRHASRASPTRSTWPRSPATRRSGPRARGASASCASPSSTRRPPRCGAPWAPGGCTSTSSTIPANGCSTCRCWSSPSPTGRAGPSRRRARRSAQTAARAWLALLATPRCRRARRRADGAAPAPQLFTRYLQAARAPDPALTAPGPGRFLLPGDLAGSPLLTFFPLPRAGRRPSRRGSLGAMLARRFESYKTHVVQPFFRDHFARLDRQIVLIDALAAVNAGAGALARPAAHAWKASSLLPARRQHAGCRHPAARASTACCSPPPRPTTCTTPATTGSRPSCACSPTRPSRAPPSPAPR